jgi:diacylglycerol kinase (ATP)
VPNAKKSAFSLGARLRSFSFAFAGVRELLRNEHNAWIHAIATIGAVVAGVVLNISREDWRWLILAIALVWISEAFNTALERLCDVVSTERNDGIRIAKDVAAGAVLISAVFAAVIGLMTFTPYLAQLYPQ